MEKIPNFLWWLQTPLLMKIMFTSVGCCRLYLFGVGLLKNRCVLWEYLLYTAHRLVHGQQQRRWFSSRDDMKNDAAFSLRLDNFQVQPKQVSTSRLTRINFSPATNYLSWKIILYTHNIQSFGQYHILSHYGSVMPISINYICKHFWLKSITYYQITTVIIKIID